MSGTEQLSSLIESLRSAVATVRTAADAIAVVERAVGGLVAAVSRGDTVPSAIPVSSLRGSVRALRQSIEKASRDCAAVAGSVVPVLGAVERTVESISVVVEGNSKVSMRECVCFACSWLLCRGFS